MALAPLLTTGHICSMIAGLGLTTSTIYAFATRQPAVRTALQTSLNTGLTAASFFGGSRLSDRACFTDLTSKQLSANIWCLLYLYLPSQRRSIHGGASKYAYRKT